MAKHKMQIIGIHCHGCIDIITKNVMTITGVKSITINPTTHIAEIEMIEEDDTASVINAIEKLGYKTSALNEENNEKFYYKLKLVKALIPAIFGFGLMGIGFFLPENYFIENFGIGILLCLLTLAIIVFAGGDFFVSAYKASMLHKATMDSLISLGSGLAFLYSSLVIIVPEIFPKNSQHIYFEVAVIIISFTNFGSFLEYKAKKDTNKAIKNLMELTPKTATLLRGELEIQVTIEEVKIGDKIKVRPGEQIPVDGVIFLGQSSIDQSMLTGEAIPSFKTKDDKVYAGTLNGPGSFIFTATKDSKNTTLAKILEIVNKASSTKPKLAKISDHVAGIFVPVVIVIAIIVGIIWFNFGPDPKLSYMLTASMSVLLISCPCALGLAIPISVIAGVGKAAQYGVLIRDASNLEIATKIDTIVFDKTGTLTMGKPEVIEVVGDKDQIVALAASIENQSEHPLAKAIVDYATKQQIKLVDVNNFNSVSGLGAKGEVAGHATLVGNQYFMQTNNIKVKLDSNKTQVFVAQNAELIGSIVLADKIKPEAIALIAKLKSMGKVIYLITGDNHIVANEVARELGIDNVLADVLPEDKFNKIMELKSAGKVVAMIGDGINDSAALASADLGIALATGSDIAIESSSVTLLDKSLLSIINFFELTDKLMSNVKQNLFAAFIYNIIGIPIAAGVLFPFTGILLNPMLASLAMALSSVTVVLNANRLRKIKL